MTREKSNATNRWVIIDISWPKDASVNLGVDKNSYLATDFLIRFFDQTTSEPKTIGRGHTSLKSTSAVHSCHMKIDPSDYDVLGLKWNDLTYFDTCLPFGAGKARRSFSVIRCVVWALTS